MLFIFLPILPLPELDLPNAGSNENCSVGVFGVMGLLMLFLDAFGVPVLGRDVTFADLTAKALCNVFYFEAAVVFRLNRLLMYNASLLLKDA